MLNYSVAELRINNINIQMIKFSLLGETILEWNDYGRLSDYYILI